MLTEVNEVKFINPKPPPVYYKGIVGWMRSNLFANVSSVLLTLLIGFLSVVVLVNFIDWGVVSAQFIPDLAKCDALRGVGACWGVIAQKGRQIVMGRYPLDEQWRPVLATLIMLVAVIVSCKPNYWNKKLPMVWLAMYVTYFILMLGGVFGLPKVDTDLWGGFPLTVLLTVMALTLAFPIAILVALGRRSSSMPAISTMCTIYVEIIRGVPLVTLLFMASFMLPLFMPEGVKIDVVLRVIVAITLFSAAYMAEVVRGGIQSIPKGQIEAAQSLGLSYWQTQKLIVLPQALAIVIPSLMNTAIGLFKDTSLVTIVSLYELTGALSLALNSDADWRPFKIEAYLFITLIYFVFCFLMSRYSLWVENRLNVSKAR
ncbi:MAG: amino acid ABC transporter permease [Gammaproteobacteria bacterium]|nr:amino acid ABC transporter permease [Gammaproteobacteria bacterium]